MSSDEIKMIGYSFVLGYPCVLLGRWCQDWCNSELGAASWKTWNFLGNAGRGGMYTWTPKPYHEDFEAVVEFRRQSQDITNETWCSYRNKQYHGHIHP